MNTRKVQVTIVMSRRGQMAPNLVRFDLDCHPLVAIVPLQLFEIVAPGYESVRATPITGQIVNKSDGTTTAHMIGDDKHHDFATLVDRLQRLPNVSNVSIG